MLRLFFTDIAGLGRMDQSALTDQQMMEMFFVPENPEDAREALCGDEDDACTWNGVTCDESDQITEIQWHSMYIEPVQGSIDFPMMPRHLTWLNLYDHKLIGAVDTANLPEALEFFRIEECLFTGTLDLGSLPRNLGDFVAMGNTITGLVNFCNLPPGLSRLYIEEPIESSAKIRIGKLPKSLNEIFLQVKCTDMLYFEAESDRDRVEMKEISVLYGFK